MRTPLPPGTARHRRPVVAVALVAVAALLGAPAVAAVPRAPVALPAAIEGYSAFQSQTTCSPTARPGTVKLRDLLLKTYPGTRNLGIVRACGVGGSSEHKEGRAFDWGVRVDRPSEKAAADAFVAWLVATDRHGNKAANARRLGIMYVIWNKRIWGSYAASSGWRAYGGASPHTDHVHISLSRAGASGATSFWTGRIAGTPAPPPAPKPPAPKPTTPAPKPTTPAPKPTTPAPKPTTPAPRPTTTPTTPAPKPSTTAPTPPTTPPGTVLPPPVPTPLLEPGPALEDEQLQVLPQRAGATTTGALVAGERYRVEVRGTWRYGPAGREVADAECSTTARDDDWERSRRVPGAPAGDAYGLHLDGRDLSLRAPGEDDDECGERGHTYATTITAARSGRVPLAVWEPAPTAGWADNSGALQVRLVHLAPRDRLEVDVDVRDPHGTTTAGSVVEDAVYRVTATGTWSPEPGVLADAMCEHEPDDDWERGDGLVLGGDRAPRLRCRDDHTYRFLWRADDSGPLAVGVRDRDFDEHTGSLHVVLERVEGARRGKR